MNLLLKTAAVSFVSVGAFSAQYNIDPAHSSVNFTAGHLGISKTMGRFNEFEGTFDDGDGSEAVTLIIKTDSIDTNHVDRDKHLRSPDFFDVKQYPSMEFKSTKFTGSELVGELTMHGKTQTVTLAVEVVGEGEDPWGGHRKGYEAKGVINRSEWGISYFIPGVPDAIEIEIQIEGIRK